MEKAQVTGLLIGGGLPAICFGLSSVLSKAAVNAKIGMGPYLLCISLAIATVAGACTWYFDDRTFTGRAAAYTYLVGFTWALGSAALAFALVKFQTPIAKLVPLYNCNTLIAVLLGLWWFAEWQQVDTGKLILGSALIVLGGALVANA